MSDTWLRARQVLARHYEVVVLGVVVLALVGGWVTYTTHVAPGTHVEQRQGPTWSATAEFSHAATVRNPNPVYEVDTTLRNRTAYFASATPVLDGTFEYGYTASEDGTLSVSVEPSLVYQRVERDHDGEVTTRYWRRTSRLDGTRTGTLAPGQSVQVPFAVNVSALANRSGQIQEQLGQAPGRTEAIVRASVTVDGTANGQRVRRTDTFTLPVRVGDVYRVTDPGETTEEFDTTRSVRVANTYGPLRRVGGPLGLAAALLAASALLVARWRTDLALRPDEREFLAYRTDRADFDEWINTIALPDGVDDMPRGRAASLGDLVDFAIDTDNSVIEDPDDGSYHVLHDGHHYVYDPPAAPADGLPVGGSEQSEGTGESAADHADDEHPDPLAAVESDEAE